MLRNIKGAEWSFTTMGLAKVSLNIKDLNASFLAVTLFLSKNIGFFFSAEAEDSYFSIDFRLKTFNIIHNLTVYTNF